MRTGLGALALLTVALLGGAVLVTADGTDAGWVPPTGDVYITLHLYDLESKEAIGVYFLTFEDSFPVHAMGYEHWVYFDEEGGGPWEYDHPTPTSIRLGAEMDLYGSHEPGNIPPTPPSTWDKVKPVVALAIPLAILGVMFYIYRQMR